MLRGLELQFRTRSRITDTEKGEALAIKFELGPIAIFIIANLPEEGEEQGPLAYVKVTLAPNEDWKIFKDHGQDMSRHKQPSNGGR